MSLPFCPTAYKLSAPDYKVSFFIFIEVIKEILQYLELNYVFYPEKKISPKCWFITTIHQYLFES